MRTQNFINHIIGSVASSYQSKKGGKDQQSIQSSTTPDPGYHKGSDKTQLNITT